MKAFVILLFVVCIVAAESRSRRQIGGYPGPVSNGIFHGDSFPYLGNRNLESYTDLLTLGSSLAILLLFNRGLGSAAGLPFFRNYHSGYPAGNSGRYFGGNSYPGNNIATLPLRDNRLDFLRNDPYDGGYPPNVGPNNGEPPDRGFERYQDGGGIPFQGNNVPFPGNINGQNFPDPRNGNGFDRNAFGDGNNFDRGESPDGQFPGDNNQPFNGDGNFTPRNDRGLTDSRTPYFENNRAPNGNIGAGPVSGNSNSGFNENIVRNDRALTLNNAPSDVLRNENNRGFPISAYSLLESQNAPRDNQYVGPVGARNNRGSRRTLVDNNERIYPADNGDRFRSGRVIVIGNRDDIGVGDVNPGNNGFINRGRLNRSYRRPNRAS